MRKMVPRADGVEGAVGPRGSNRFVASMSIPAVDAVGLDAWVHLNQEMLASLSGERVDGVAIVNPVTHGFYVQKPLPELGEAKCWRKVVVWVPPVVPDEAPLVQPKCWRV